MTMDPRIAERRSEVREGSARGEARRLLAWFGALALVGVLAWVAQLPAFSVQEVQVSGAERADVDAALVAGGVEEGRPLVLVRPGPVEASLRTDPWVVDARVSHVFPDTLAVEVAERRPVVNIRSSGRVLLVADDGVVASTVADPDLPTVDLPGVARTPVGDVVGDARAAGIADFLGALPPQLVDAGVLSEVEGELWYDLQGIGVRLGRAVDMTAKAGALEALVADGLAPGSTVHLVSATRPAVEPPGRAVEEPPPATDEADDAAETP